MKQFKTLSLSLIALLSSLASFSQNLPVIQPAGLQAPQGINIDGKPNEWGGNFQAFNRATSVFYTMANDDKNLYMVIKCEEQPTIAKILSGGITLALKSAANKEAQAVKIVYPLISYTDKYTISIPLREDADVEKMAITLNKELPKVAKQINVSGISEIKEPSVSIYNDWDIKAVSAVDTKRAYTIEWQVPLKYLRHLISADGSFDYNIIVNGVVNPPGTIVVGGGRIGGAPPKLNEAAAFDMFNPTDFKGSYTLMKK
ncbi:hypothetical protein ACFQZS_11345 [Mucilaginibacter calamicampi]|uniref:Uncharacterized protein n=1 Tax=Mucilaginibacter calamicampi TaxID=1302352 RepID=A0ABW2YW94_9SPHI